MSLKKQQSQLNQFTRTVTFCKAIPVGTTINELIQRLENVKQLFTEFKQNQEQVEESCGEDNIDVQFTMRGQVEDYFFYCCSRFNEAIDYLKAKKQDKDKEHANKNAPSQQQEVKLPRIELTPFSGLYEDWTSFKDLYTTLIHDNKSIANDQKLHYLKTNVEGDAYGLLKSINVTEANYPDAWKKLMDRYEHKRYIVDSLLKRFFEQPAVTCENHSEIKALIDKSSEIVQGLKVQGLPVNQWDTILVYVVVSKLDGETHKHWELRLKKDELPTFSDLQEFLEARRQSLEMISGSNVPSSQPKSSIATIKPNQSGGLKRSNSNVQNQPNGCACCSSVDHTIGSCPRYVKLDLESRLQFIKSKNLCFNCLRVGHSLKNCKSRSTCQQCHKNHHTSIHNDKRVSVMTSERALKLDETSDIPRPRKLDLLATAVVHIFDKFGEVTAVKTLIDQGSENAIIKSGLAKRLGFERSTYFSSVKGIGDIPVESEPVLFTFRIGSCVIPSFTMEVEAISME
ncbi:uncharacterized protein LOC119083867 [Bradysia coprophila]|uniref:uncharacterized protein LOC119083867 n=1 Tax=Bradysia coprophila TaxID=38358 RepID=UPI00187D7402|nr:uncharacterized protein LOC119083867 [Bradysia coprophila]